MTIPAFRRTKVIMNKRQHLIHISERMNLSAAKHRFNLSLLGIPFTPPPIFAGNADGILPQTGGFYV